MLTKNDKSWIKKNSATKNDLKNLVTKKDAKHFATKDDLKNFVTKNDLIGLARSKELDELKITFTDNLTKWKSELFDKIDKVLGRLISCEQEKEILQAREDEREVLASRIDKLEKIHPDNRHTSI